MSVIRTLKKQFKTKTAKLCGVVSSRRKPKTPAAKGTAFVEMTITSPHRRLYLLAVLLAESGYDVAVFLTVRGFFNLDRIGVSLFKRWRGGGIPRLLKKENGGGFLDHFGFNGNGGI